MKQFFSKQLTNIVFLVLIVAAALAIYLLSRAESAPASASVDASAVSPSPSPTASEAPAPRGIPEAVFQTHLETSDRYTAKASRNDPRAVSLTFDDEDTTVAQLLYSAQYGCISSLEFSVDLPKTYDSDSKSTIEQYLYKASQKKAAVVDRDVRSALEDLFPVSDAENRLQAATVRYWAEQALLLSKNGADFEDKQDGCRFLAYLTVRDDMRTLVCCLFFE